MTPTISSNRYIAQQKPSIAIHQVNPVSINKATVASKVQEKKLLTSLIYGMLMYCLITRTVPKLQRREVKFKLLAVHELCFIVLAIEPVEHRIFDSRFDDTIRNEQNANA